MVVNPSPYLTIVEAGAIRVCNPLIGVELDVEEEVAVDVGSLFLAGGWNGEVDM